MYKLLYFFILLLLVSSKNFAQTTPDVKLTEKDSLEILSQLMNMLDSSADNTNSYLFANVGVGNRLFSVKNKALNTYQNSTSTMIYSPSLAYFNKTGLGLTAGANLLHDGNSFGVNQYSLSPSFNLTGSEKFGFDISYTRYFVKDKYSPFSSPVQNEFYSSVSYKKAWLQPGIAAGYSWGEYKDTKYKDSVVLGIRRRFYDSIVYQLNSFLLMASVGHKFKWNDILNKSDGIILSTTLMVNAGSAQTKITHNSNAINLFKILNKRGKIRKIRKSPFEVQSLGFNIDLDYTIGRFTFEPQYYIDYYLPAVDVDINRLTNVFTLNIGYTF